MLKNKYIFILGSVILFQVNFFHYHMYKPNKTSTAEAVVVFAGSDARVMRAYRLLEAGAADVLIISPSNENDIAIYRDKFSAGGEIAHITETQARNTFENALYVKRIICQYTFRSIILVTSEFHMPRSYALLRMMCMGKDVEILTHKTKGLRNTLNMPDWIFKELLLIREMCKFWGSLYQWLFHCASAWHEAYHSELPQLFQHNLGTPGGVVKRNKML
jgi:uncharacterized SAM-binding protein YcdF (DUF218 family)